MKTATLSTKFLLLILAAALAAAAWWLIATPDGWSLLTAYSDPYAVCYAPDLDEETLAAYRGVSVAQIQAVKDRYGKSNRSLCLASGNKLARMILHSSP